MFGDEWGRKLEHPRTVEWTALGNNIDVEEYTTLEAATEVGI